MVAPKHEYSEDLEARKLSELNNHVCYNLAVLECSAGMLELVLGCCNICWNAGELGSGLWKAGMQNSNLQQVLVRYNLERCSAGVLMAGLWSAGVPPSSVLLSRKQNTRSEWNAKLNISANMYGNAYMQRTYCKLCCVM